MAIALTNRTGTATSFRTHAFDGRSLTDDGLLDDKELRTNIIVVLRIGDRTLESLGNQGSCFLGNECKLLKSVYGWKALDFTGDLACLEG